MTTSDSMNKVADRANERMKPIKDAMSDLAGDAKQASADVGHDLARLKTEIVAVVREAMHTAFDGASDKAAGAYDSLKQNSKVAAKSLQKNVVAHPLATLAIACGVGLIVGCLMSRKD